MFLWLNAWSCHSWCFVSLNDITDLHMSSLGILVPEWPSSMFYATRRQVYWGLTQCVFLLLLWFDFTHSQTKIQHTQGQWDKYKYMLTHPVMCSQQLSVLRWMNNSLMSKMSLRCLCFSKITHLQKSDICWLGSFIGPPRLNFEPGNKRCSW